MQAILDMVRMIAVFYLLEQMVLQLIPGERYERYVRFYLGLLLVLLLLQPVFQIFRLSEQLDQKVFLQEREMEEMPECRKNGKHCEKNTGRPERISS